jgi:hypothetical protein
MVSYSKRAITHCKDTILRIRNKFSQKRKCGGLSPNFHIYVSVSDLYIYSHDRSAYSAPGKYVDQSWEYLNSSQTHEWGNWEWGRAFPFLGIHKWDFRCSSSKLMDLNYKFSDSNFSKKDNRKEECCITGR